MFGYSIRHLEGQSSDIVLQRKSMLVCMQPVLHFVYIYVPTDVRSYGHILIHKHTVVHRRLLTEREEVEETYLQ